MLKNRLGEGCKVSESESENAIGISVTLGGGSTVVGSIVEEYACGCVVFCNKNRPVRNLMWILKVLMMCEVFGSLNRAVKDSRGQPYRRGPRILVSSSVLGFSV